MAGLLLSELVGRWTRRVWMRCAALSCVGAIPFWIWANLGDVGARSADLKIGAQIQFVHAMASFACATFMNLGARSARHAPACFLSGSILISGSLYLTPFVSFAPLRPMVALGGVVLVGGWTILLVAAGQVDRPDSPAGTSREPKGNAQTVMNTPQTARNMRKETV